MQKLSRSGFLTMLIFCIIVIAAVARKPRGDFITAQKALNSLESYTATVIYRVIDGQEEREYRLNNGFFLL